MRDLAISYGNSRQAKTWVNKTISFDALKERLKTTIRTTESAEEYAKMSKAQRDAAKDHGGFVGGTLRGGRRKIDTVELRSMIALDGDRIDKDFLENYEATAPYTSVLYTTHSSTEEAPRVRIIFPMTRDVSSEEFVAISRYVAQSLGIDFFDECSYQPNQLMYWPSTPANGVFIYKEAGKTWLNPDTILSAHPEWTDPTRLPTSSRESKANTVKQQKVQDPLSKDGVVGLFNRVYYPVTRALEAFLSDVYEPTDNPNRWHLIESKSIAGVEVKDDVFVYSHHAKDPAYLMLLKDLNGNYIWKPGLDVAKPDTILGRPIYTSSYMPAITGNATQDKNKKVLLFGDFNYYWIADRKARTLKRLNELYAVTDQVGFIGTQRVDGKLILPEAMQVMALGSGAASSGS